MDPADTHMSRHVRRLLWQGTYTVTMDKAFASVMEACARPRGGKAPLTWITPQIMRAYWQAYKAGYAHSVEVWDDDGTLVAGAYGLAIGKMYFGESQFCTVRDTSKLANVALAPAYGVLGAAFAVAIATVFWLGACSLVLARVGGLRTDAVYLVGRFMAARKEPA